MSNILVQNIKHTNNTTSMSIDTSGQVSVRGEGSATTTNLQQGLAKAWCQFNGNDSSVDFADSFNMSGITDNGTGDFTVSFANDMANATYANSVECTFFSHVYDSANTATGSVRIATTDASGTKSNRTITSYLNAGDLA
tara:strand:- start:33 stop:449 length:417 start_codon:yes stop_codon:yes gene_type:complete